MNQFVDGSALAVGAVVAAPAIAGGYIVYGDYAAAVGVGVVNAIDGKLITGPMETSAHLAGYTYGTYYAPWIKTRFEEEDE